jgi:TRAP-type C4-dicarboxylate transport system substrate-binding protein
MFKPQRWQKKETDLVSFLVEKGMEIYEPDLSAFRSHVQKLYLTTSASDSWPAGVLDKINALGK